MKLGANLLDSAATLNRFTKLTQVEIAQGETYDLVFQLTDLDQAGLRYVPLTGATLLVEIPRFPDTLATSAGVRQIVDYSVRRGASLAFPSDDRSIWKLSLTTADTANLASSNIRLTLTEGTSVKIAIITMALRVFCSES